MGEMRGQDNFLIYFTKMPAITELLLTLCPFSTHNEGVGLPCPLLRPPLDHLPLTREHNYYTHTLLPHHTPHVPHRVHCRGLRYYVTLGMAGRTNKTGEYKEKILEVFQLLRPWDLLGHYIIIIIIIHIQYQ